MHQSVEWVKPTDRIIVQEVARYGGWIKPSSLYINLDLSQAHVQRRCKELAERGVLERHDDEVAYRVDDLGRQWILGEATPQMLAATDRE